MFMNVYLPDAEPQPLSPRRARPALRPMRASVLAHLLATCLLAPSGAAWAQGNTGNTEQPSAAGLGPITLQQRSPRAGAELPTPSDAPGYAAAAAALPAAATPAPVVAEKPGEFERYVQGAVGTEFAVRRFGSELMTPSARAAMTGDGASQIPTDYVVGIGDEIQVTLWGSVEADLRLTVDRSGRITLPRVGPVLVAGLRYADLNAAIDQRVAQVFKNYKLSTALGRLRSIRVYVTGSTQRPGAYTTSSLSTLVNALMQAGGPTAAGSYRNIELRRAGKLLTTFDLYDLLIKGDKTADRTLQAEDVIHVGTVGNQVALVGSVNRPAIFELRQGESLGDVLNFAGGFTPVADRSRLTAEAVAARNDKRIVELALPQQLGTPPRNGDLLRAYSAVETLLPQFKQNRRVVVEGEVRNPGEYILPANSTLQDALSAAGGLTPDAFVFGTEFNRDSVRRSQTENYDRALRDLETEFTRNSSSQRVSTADEAAAQSARAQSSVRLIERLRSVRPTGRIVFELTPSSAQLPNLTLEEGDRLRIPARPSSVGVFGSVFNAGSYLYKAGTNTAEFVKQAGGTTRTADAGSAFVLRANGTVVSARQNAGWLTAGKLESIPAEPGDTIFVPEEMNRTTFLQEAKDWTQIFYQFGLGAAGLKVLKN